MRDAVLPSEAGMPEHSRSVVRVFCCRNTEQVKSIEEKIANLKETELGAKVTAARTKEEADREKVGPARRTRQCSALSSRVN